jgi:hypothetical protein
MHVAVRILVTALTCTLASCAASQVRMNALQMVADISQMREIQVYRNISAAISDHDMVPAEIFLGTGQATVATVTSAGLKLPQFDFSQPSRELGPLTSATWTATWTIAPVTNSDDLRRLRNLYVLVASTDAQYDELQAFFVRHPELRTQPACADETRMSGTSAGHSNPIGTGPGQVPKWCQAIQVMANGDSIGCKLYQEQGRTEARRGGLPFRRWLYWRQSGGDWLPERPPSDPSSVGAYEGWELGITSRACFNDFVILVQSATPAAAGASAQGPRALP